ncbi:MAG: tetratricopeptide repeat protein [Planctomycetales bacterium]
MNGSWNNYWNRPWFAGAAMWGMGAWALGSVVYDSGYAMYSNPYYTSSPGYYDYSQPIQVVTQPTEVIVVQGTAPADPAAQVAEALVQPPPAVQASRTHLDAARDAFLAADYATAGREVDLALKELPTDAALHEFRALVYFAAADYPKAAGTLYAVLSAGPGWDWTTMSSLYPSVDAYTVQLRALEQYVKGKPDAADGHFVLAYHYTTGSHTEAAIHQLQEVVRLQPADQLAVQLVRGLGGEVPSQSGASPAPGAQEPQVAGEDPPPPPDIDPVNIVGRRTAKRTDGTTFTLDLTADNKFTWSFERGGKKQEFGGTYSVDGAVLVLERGDKAQMPGLVTMQDKDFNFKLFGAPESDPGLDFKS